MLIGKSCAECVTTDIDCLPIPMPSNENIMKQQECIQVTRTQDSSPTFSCNLSKFSLLLNKT